MRLRAPADVRARASGERVLAWLPSGTSSVVATDAHLVLPEGATPPRIAWDLVLRASWEEEMLEVTLQPTPGARPVSVRVPVTGAVATLAGVVRERVNASIVVQDRLLLTGDRGARVVARRVPGSTELRWSLVFDAGLDPTDPELRARADAALADSSTPRRLTSR